MFERKISSGALHILTHWYKKKMRFENWTIKFKETDFLTNFPVSSTDIQT